MKSYLVPFLFFIIVTASYAQLTSIPDSNFEAYLEANTMGNGIANDHFVTTANIDNVFTLDVSSQNIADLTGIEDFTSLTNLHCEQNVLETLNISANTGLTTLYCHTNNLEEIDISTNIALRFFYCNSNSIDELDLTSNTALLTLECSFNQLTNIDLSSNTSIIYLDCGANQITNLDLSLNTALEHVYCYNNELTTLDLRNYNNTIITGFSSENNENLFCIYVDNIAWSETNWTNIDAHTSFELDEASCTASVNSYSNNLNFSLAPNPAKNSFKITTHKKIINVKIYNLLGKLIKVYLAQENYSVSSLSKGIYLVSIQSEEGVGTKKLLIE